MEKEKMRSIASLIASVGMVLTATFILLALIFLVAYHEPECPTQGCSKTSFEDSLIIASPGDCSGSRHEVFELHYYNKTTSTISIRCFTNSSQITDWLYDIGDWSGYDFADEEYPLSECQKNAIILNIVWISHYEDTGRLAGE